MTLTEKITRLIAELGWTQDAFAKQAGLNRNTVCHMFTRPNQRLHQTTVRRCADALELTVLQLQQTPIEQLLPLIRNRSTNGKLQSRLLDLASQPELSGWVERNPERARNLTANDIDELLSLQGTGGPLTQFGVEHFVGQIERKRRLRQRIEAIAGTEYIDLLEQFVELLFEKVQPFKNDGRPTQLS